MEQAALDRPHGGIEDRNGFDPGEWSRPYGVGPGRGGHGETLARALGFFSLGLGLAQIMAPRRLGRAIGVGEHPALMRGLGVREISSGIGILTNDHPTNWVWSRVAGDIMDLALLNRARDEVKGPPERLAAAMAAVGAALVLDAWCARELSRSENGTAARGREPEGIRVRHAITINRPAGELYDFWRDLGNLPRIMDHVKSVEVTGDRSHWTVKGPAGMTVEWDAVITEDRPGRLIAWRSLEGSDVDSEGTVQFLPAPGSRGTVVRLDLRYSPPAGRAGAAFARLFGRSAGQEIRSDLRPFKQLMETGEVTTTEGQPAGQRTPIGKLTETLEH